MTLLDCRKDAGVPDTNPYLFARIGLDTHVRGSDVLREAGQAINAAKPESLKTTLLRKHIATTTQILNLKDNELDILANFLGHDIAVHRKFYRLPDETLQLAKVSKLLIAMESGQITSCKGKNLDTINIQENEEIINDDIHSSDEEETVCIEAGENDEEKHQKEQQKGIEATNTPLPLKTGRSCLKKPWSAEEKSAVERHCLEYISQKRLPDPPTSPPVITGSASLTDSQPVYEGDSISLTCTVHGGKPVNATVITFTCPNKLDTPDISTNSYSISGRLTLDAVSPHNHGTCFCRTRWKSYDWYNMTVSWVLSVYTPPSVPIIFPSSDTTGRPSYPFLEDTDGTLYCYSNKTGRPEATYTWPVPASGHVSGSNLTFYQLKREDNGRLLKCRASNDYTEKRRPVDDAAFVLTVYYKPVVTFTLVSDTNNCLQVSSQLAPTQCVVAQGKTVHISCTADSNPAPASFLWLKENKDVFSNTSELVITSANHTTHNGDYNCTVFTKQEQGDSRLPLTSSAILTVIVGYSPSVLVFTINSADNTSGNVRENSSVTLKCLSNGRPTPSMRLINAADPTQVLNQSQPTGDIFAEDQTGEVVFRIDQVSCGRSGVYRCKANNTLGQDEQSGTLFVFCAPRINDTTGQPPTINITDGKGQYSFEMTAYPTPNLTTLTFLGGDLNGSHGESTAKENIIQATCSASQLALAIAVCSITVFGITANDEGYYKAVFNNRLGGIAYKFYVKEATQSKTDSKLNENVVAVIALAVVLTVVSVLVVVAVIWFWRRGLSFPCADNRNQRHSRSELNQPSGDSFEHSLPSVTTKVSCRKEGPQYETLRLEDVGVRSPYEEIRREINTQNTSHYEDI